MKSINKNRGFSLSGFIMLLVGFAVIGGLGFQVGFTKLQKRTIEKTITEVLAEGAQKDWGAREIQSSLIKRFDVNNIPATKDNIVVSKAGTKGFRVSVSISREVRLFEGVTLVMDASADKSSEQ